ncbi:DUF262 domain-containing protein [Kutzneria chonburiensis]|uniref:DUF262 domain-containing protein n=1 Tax=Kutzneria chonburiensis TaxID=1483604 RepID=A0ABV6MUK4_9PSEU|nr:DUF262 domain-containing protein [Kutzneria chonburiensis]
MNQRRHTTQTVAWFLDLYRRELLILDPPYQRRSVWNQSYADYFIDTMLLNYPAPAIFLYEDISDSGKATYSVVDGRQRLTTVLRFVEDEFPVGDSASTHGFRGKFFKDLPSDIRKDFYRYQFSIEYLPSTDEGTLSNIFDRINRNVAKLTPQELRHARFSGEFATSAERLSEFMTRQLDENFPRVNQAARRQMKDVELAVNLMLLVESGIASYSQAELDKAYSDREDNWEEASRVDTEFRQTIATLRDWQNELLVGDAARFRNQADFYSLFAIILELHREQQVPQKDDSVKRLREFMAIVLDDKRRSSDENAAKYYEATRSASSDQAPRRDRVRILRQVLLRESNVSKS